ncbi:type II secretion system protein [Faecalimicrobium sp. JNUCC 81]
MKKNRGFTLVELLVVIAIIGILAAVALPALFKNINNSKMAKLKSELNAFKSSSMVYYTENNRLPINKNEMSENIEEMPKRTPFTVNVRNKGYNIIPVYKKDSKELERIDIGMEVSESAISRKYFEQDEELKKVWKCVTTTPNESNIYGVYVSIYSPN